MDPPAPPPASAVTDPLPPLPTAPPKIRLMCSYGGHIIPRPQNKPLCYSGGETRIVGVDRRTTCSSLGALTAHLSRSLFNNLPFHLKYQLPNEDLDSLISVTTDEDLQNMLEEHDRVSAMVSPTPARIRLFLFPAKAESVGSVLQDPKSDSWFSDALNNTTIVQRGQSADAGLGRELMGLSIAGQSDGNGSSEHHQVESLSNTGGVEAKEIGGTVPESLVLETSSSFGSTSSSISMSNLPAVDGGVGFFEKKIRVPSSASLESDNSAASAGIQPKTGIYQEPYIQVASGVSSNVAEIESSASDPQSVLHMPKNAQHSGHQLSHQPDGKQLQYEVQYQYSQGDPHYVPQYQSGALPLPSYYPVYQMPLHQQLHNHYPVNQPYPVYLVPVRSNHNYGMPMQYSLMENVNVGSSRPPLHPQAAIITPMTSKDATPMQSVPEAASKVYQTVPVSTPAIAPSTQGKQQFVEHPELQHPSQPTMITPVACSSNYVNEFHDDIAYSQIYKTQPSAPALPLQYETVTKGVNVMISELPSQEHMNVKHQNTLHPQ